MLKKDAEVNENAPSCQWKSVVLTCLIKNKTNNNKKPKSQMNILKEIHQSRPQKQHKVLELQSQNQRMRTNKEHIVHFSLTWLLVTHLQPPKGNFPVSTDFVLENHHDLASNLITYSCISNIFNLSSLFYVFLSFFTELSVLFM